MGVPGFDVEIAIAATANFYAAKFPDVEDKWVPSTSWMYRFFNHIGLVGRRITSFAHRTTPATLAAQQRMVDANDRYLAALLRSGTVTLRYIFSSDELGVKLIPNRSIVWEQRGAKNVVSPMPESKAQHTCDYVTNGAGEIVYLVEIFAGKTERSLPGPSVRAKCKRTLFFATENHW